MTKNRKAWQFARMIEKVVESYPRVRTIHLVRDNLNTHKEKSLIGYFGESRSKDRIADLSSMKARAHAWTKRMNREKVKINWTFTRKKAREKFKY